MKSFQFSFEAIGTAWVIDIYDPLSLSKQQDIVTAVKKRIEEYDSIYSRFRSDSLIHKIAKNDGEYIFPKDSKELFTIYRKLYDITDGAFTPFIGDVLEDMGYDEKYSLQPKSTIRKALPWDEAIAFKFPKLIVKTPVLLDFGAAGKGHLVDLIGVLLELDGITSYCIDAGGDILYKSLTKEPLRIGLENPENLKQVIGLVNITNGSICGSAGNRRKWADYHHIVNPHTNTSPKDILSVWVIAKKAIVADALATALYFIDPKKASEHFTFDYAMLYKDLSLQKSESFPGEIFYNTV